MKKMKKLLFIFLFVCPVTLFSAEYTPEIIQNIMEQISEDKEEEIDAGMIEDNLAAFSEQPIDLNHTSRQELEKLYFLSAIQIENLLYYLYRFAPMYSIYELKLVEGFDEETIQNLLPFVTLEQEKASNSFNLPYLLKNAKQNVYVKSQTTLEEKEGYSANASKKYLGEPFYLMTRYNFQSKNRLFFGFTAEKDEGEAFWKKQHRGFDFYSAHLQLNDLGIFKTIVLGNYRAAFGLGLVMNNNFSMGKSSYVLNVLPSGSGVNKSSSANESNYFNGAAATIRLGKVDMTYFYSYKKMDASLHENIFTSIKTDGLHRTEDDWKKRKNITQQVMGANITYAQYRFKVGATLAGTKFSHEWQPEPAPYNLHYFRGKEQLSGSIDYFYNWKRMFFAGETAYDFNSASVATLNSLSFSPTSKAAFVAVQRYYSPAYQAIHANTFAENSRINNEQGFYIGTEIHPVKSWKLSAYSDIIYFPWLRNGVDRASEGYDVLFQVDYNPTQDLGMFLRYKNKQKEKNIALDENITNKIGKQDKATLKYVINYRLTRNIRLSNSIETNYIKTCSQQSTTGFYIAQDLSLSCGKTPLKIDFRYAFFDTEAYDNRFYQYEKDVLYNFSIPMLYGKGTRIYANLSYILNEYLSFWFKIAYTNYLDKESIGSNLETIAGSHKTDLRLMLRARF